MTGLRQNEDYYFNEDGLMVLTARYLLRRGYCCGNGCFHCPYNYEQVPRPLREELREARSRRQRKSNEQSRNL